MSYASKLGRAQISSSSPRAAAVCDRCGFVYNHVDLQWQYDWAGAAVINKRILVCRSCLDQMQEQLRAIVLPADPMPIQNPRIQDYVTAETDYRLTQGNTVDPTTGLPIYGGTQRATQTNLLRVGQQTGFANGSLNTQPGTDPNAPGNSTPGLPYQNIAVPETGDL